MLKHALTAVLAALSITTAASAQQETLPRRSTLGASAQTIATGGVEVVTVRPGTPAARAGLAVGDVIRQIGDQPVANAQDFVAAVRAARTNRATPFSVTRAGASQVVPVTLTEAPRESVPGLIIDYGAVRVDGSLRRTLMSYPTGPAQRRPAMLLVGGIGCYSIDDALSEDVYRTLAHDLSRRGLVVMRVEKSGMGDSQGAPCATVDYETEHAAYEAALTALRTDRRVDPTQVFVFGHSIGTLHAPTLANSQRVAGVIAAEGAVRTWIEYEYINTRRQMELAGASAADISEALLLKTQCMDRAQIGDEPVADVVAEIPDCAGLLIFPASQAYMRQLTAMNIAAPWASVSAPVLAIYGTADFVTDVDEHQRVVDIVNAAHPGAASLAVIEGMEHGLTQAGTQAEAFARLHRGEHGSYEPQFSQVIGDWICARARCADARIANR